MTDPQFTAGFNAGIEAARQVVFGFSVRSSPHSFYEACEAISALTVPSDLVAVPREPNEEMLSGAADIFGLLKGTTRAKEHSADIYRAMLSAYEEKKDE